MKIEILGSGNIYSKWNSASYLVDDKILIDVPNGTHKTLKNRNVEPININKILITHFHGDHYFDLPFILLEKLKKSKNISNIFCDDTGEKKINFLSKLAFPNKADEFNTIINYIYDTNFKIEEYTIEKIEMKHEEGINAFGYIFQFEKNAIGFTGDTRLCENVELMASKCNNLFCDCNSEIGTKYHMGIDNIVYLANKYKSCNFYTSHMDDNTRTKLNNLNLDNVNILQDRDIYIF